MNEYNNVRVLEVECVIDWDVMNNQRVGNIALFQVHSVIIGSFQ